LRSELSNSRRNGGGSPLDELRSELDGFAQPERKSGLKAHKGRSARSAREERIIAGFEDIQRFVEERGLSEEQREELAEKERDYQKNVAPYLT
jgi:hypothetical protein